MNFLLAFVVCFLAVQQVSIAQGGPKFNEKSTYRQTFAQLAPQFFESSIYQRTVAYDAPVIDPEETAKLLPQLEPLISGEGNARLSFERLMSLVNYENVEHCKGNGFDVLSEAQTMECPLSSSSGRQPFGPNILAFIKHYKLKVFNHCRSILKRSVIDAASFSSLKEFILFMLPNNKWPQRERDYFELLEPPTEKMQAYLAKTIPNFDKKKKTAQGKEEILENLHKIQNACDKLKSGFELRRFVTVALKSDDFKQRVIKDKELIEVASTMELCDTINYYTKDENWIFGERGKSLFSYLGRSN